MARYLCGRFQSGCSPKSLWPSYGEVWGRPWHRPFAFTRWRVQEPPPVAFLRRPGVVRPRYSHSQSWNRSWEPGTPGLGRPSAWPRPNPEWPTWCTPCALAPCLQCHFLSDSFFLGFPPVFRSCRRSSPADSFSPSAVIAPIRSFSCGATVFQLLADFLALSCFLGLSALPSQFCREKFALFTPVRP